MSGMFEGCFVGVGVVKGGGSLGKGLRGGGERGPEFPGVLEAVIHS